VLALASIAATPSCAPPEKDCDTRVVGPPNVVRDSKGKPLVAVAAASVSDHADVTSYHVHIQLWWRPQPSFERVQLAATDYDTCASVPRPGHNTKCGLADTCRIGYWSPAPTGPAISQLHCRNDPSHT
jgi:hypothetical protein